MDQRGSSWIITYVMSGNFLTYDLFKADVLLVGIDECHYTHDAAVVYLYVHFTSPVPLRWVSMFMDKMRLEKNIVLFDIFGYNSITTSSTTTRLTDHIGFKILLDHFHTKHSSFKAWTNGDTDRNSIRGLLWKSDSVPRIRKLLRQRSKSLESCFAEIEKELAEYKDQKDTIELMREQITEQKEKLDKQKKKITKLTRFELSTVILKFRIKKLDQATRDILLAPDYWGRPI